MTQPARISQADMERALKSVKAVGLEKARVVMDLEARTIEVILGECIPRAASRMKGIGNSLIPSSSYVASMLHGIAGNAQKRQENGGNAGKRDAT